MSGDLVEPLRQRLEAAVADGDGDNDAITKRVRAVYREWKTQRIDEQLDDLFRLAFARGAVEALPAGTAVQWVVDPNGPPSPDCEDNALAGSMAIGAGVPVGPPVAPDAPWVPLPPARDRRVACAACGAHPICLVAVARVGASPAGRSSSPLACCSWSSSSSGGRWPASTSTSCGTTGSGGRTSSGVCCAPR